MRLTAKPKRSAMPVVKTALERARTQLVLAQNAAALSGEPQIAETIASATKSLDVATAAMQKNSRGLH